LGKWERGGEGRGRGRTTPVVGSKMASSILKKGTVAEPGLVSMASGKGITTMDPVSICLKPHQSAPNTRRGETKTHQNVSTIAHCFLPTCSLYQFHASGLIGSPTLPSTLKLPKIQIISLHMMCPQPPKRNKTASACTFPVCQ
jgi:hypothetical protein